MQPSNRRQNLSPFVAEAVFPRLLGPAPCTCVLAEKRLCSALPLQWGFWQSAKLLHGIRRALLWQLTCCPPSSSSSGVSRFAEPQTQEGEVGWIPIAVAARLLLFPEQVGRQELLLPLRPWQWLQDRLLMTVRHTGCSGSSGIDTSTQSPVSES